MNTKQNGQVSLLIMDTGNNNYLGICYEFAIVLEGDDIDILKQDLLDSARGYVAAVNKESLPNELLDKSDMLPKEFKQLFDEVESRFVDRKVNRKLSQKYEDAIQAGRTQLVPASV